MKSVSLLVRLYLSTLKMEATWSPKYQLTFKGLHGVISMMTELFIITAVRTSNATELFTVVHRKFNEKL
jgi:hypothetical protein